MLLIVRPVLSQEYLKTILPAGSYLYQLFTGVCQSDISCVESKVRIVVSENGKRTLVYKGNKLPDVDHYVNQGFDIVLAGNNLGLKPGKPDTIAHWDHNNRSVNAEDGSTQFNWRPNSIPMPMIELPDTCVSEQTIYQKKHSLLKTQCYNRNGDLISTFLPLYYPAQCDSLQNR